MAERRMFAKSVIDSDAFLDMPLSSQCLYFHLGMRADDDGFVDGPKKVQRMIGATDDDAGLLIAKGFVIPFESGVIVIRHWKIHNYIQSDRYKPTLYQEEMKHLHWKKGQPYIPDTECIQDVSILDTQYRLGKDRLGKDRLGEVRIDKVRGEVQERGKDSPNPPAAAKPPKHKHGEYGHVFLTDDEMARLDTDYGVELRNKAITYLDEYIEMKGTKYKSHYMAIRKWVIDAVQKHTDMGNQSKTQKQSRLSWMDELVQEENTWNQ